MSQPREENKYSTQAIQRVFPEVYPRKEDPKAFSKYLEEQRTSITTADWEAHEQDRRRVTEDNKIACRNRQTGGISSTDFFYQEGHPLRHQYKTHKNDRDNPHTGEGPGNTEYRRNG